MRYYVPELALDDGTAQFRERLGGLPFGLEASRWPKCSDCGKSQSLLAQFEHHSGRLDLRRIGRNLLIFQCAHDPGMCDTWEAFSGANACLVVEPEDLRDGPTQIPDDAPPMENPVLITGWITRDDDLTASEYEAFFSEETFTLLPDETPRKIVWSTRLGSAPCWIQSPDEAPKPDWQFLGQLDSTYSFMTEPSGVRSWISADAEHFEGRTHVGQGPNFGDGGLAYIFARDNGGVPEVVMFWQCG